jgi:phage terminase large subunit
VEESNRDSTFAELQGAVFRMFGEYAGAVWRVSASPLAMENMITGNRIIFRGMKDISQREKVKSITFKKGKLCWIWIEEATEMLYEDIDILDDRLRGELEGENQYYQMTMTFNPVSAAHWIKGRYFDQVHPDVFTHHSIYKDNRFIDEAYYRRMERRNAEDPEGYQVYGLGEWGELGGLILTNWAAENISLNIEDYDSVSLGQDFGYNHADAILLLGRRDGNIYILRELYVYEKDTEEIIQVAGDMKDEDGKRVFPKNKTMYCDSAEPDRIKTWKKAGYRAVAVVKETNSINAGIDFLKRRKIYVHPGCRNTIKELSQWKWKKDKTTGLYVDEEVDFMNDACSALRYGCEPWRKAREAKVYKKKDWGLR